MPKKPSPESLKKKPLTDAEATRALSRLREDAYQKTQKKQQAPATASVTPTQKTVTEPQPLGSSVDVSKGKIEAKKVSGREEYEAMRLALEERLRARMTPRQNAPIPSRQDVLAEKVAEPVIAADDDTDAYLTELDNQIAKELKELKDILPTIEGASSVEKLMETPTVIRAEDVDIDPNDLLEVGLTIDDLKEVPLDVPKRERSSAPLLGQPRAVIRESQPLVQTPQSPPSFLGKLFNAIGNFFSSLFKREPAQRAAPVAPQPVTRTAPPPVHPPQGAASAESKAGSRVGRKIEPTKEIKAALANVEKKQADLRQQLGAVAQKRTDAKKEAVHKGVEQLVKYFSRNPLNQASFDKQVKKMNVFKGIDKPEQLQKLYKGVEERLQRAAQERPLKASQMKNTLSDARSQQNSRMDADFDVKRPGPRK